MVICIKWMLLLWNTTTTTMYKRLIQLLLFLFVSDQVLRFGILPNWKLSVFPGNPNIPSETFRSELHVLLEQKSMLIKMILIPKPLYIFIRIKLFNGVLIFFYRQLKKSAIRSFTGKIITLLSEYFISKIAHLIQKPFLRNIFYRRVNTRSLSR